MLRDIILDGAATPPNLGGELPFGRFAPFGYFSTRLRRSGVLSFLLGFHFSRSGKAISLAGFHFSRSGKAIPSFPMSRNGAHFSRNFSLAAGMSSKDIRWRTFQS